MQTNKCPDCSLVNFASEAKCKRCGTDLNRSTSQPMPTQTHISTTCPQCNCTETQSFEMAYRLGTSSGNISVTSYNLDIGMSVSGGRITNQTALAAQVKPPTTPTPSAGLQSAVMGFLCWAFATTILIYVSVIISGGSPSLGMPLILASMVGGCVLAFIAARGVRRIAEVKDLETFQIYEKSLAKWSREWICLRCGKNWAI